MSDAITLDRAPCHYSEPEANAWVSGYESGRDESFQGQKVTRSKVYECALASILAGAPGLKSPVAEGIARSIALKVMA